MDKNNFCNSIWFDIEKFLDAANSPLPLSEQKIQPYVDRVPSLLGHENPPSRESFTVFPEKYSQKKSLKDRNLFI